MQFLSVSEWRTKVLISQRLAKARGLRQRGANGSDSRPLIVVRWASQGCSGRGGSGGGGGDRGGGS